MRGEDGYHFNLKQIDLPIRAETNKKITLKEFYAYRIMIRENDQQFLVDMYAKIEAKRMIYIRQNQRKLRTEEYIHLRDAILNDNNVEDIEDWLFYHPVI